MEKPKDYYRILGVSRDASMAAIKRAYQRLAKAYKPEAQAHPSLEALEEVQAAYEILGDAEQRRRYDETLTKVDQDHFGPLSWSFVRSPAAGDLRRPTRPGSMSGEILLTAEEARKGGTLPLDVPISTACPACDGTGGFVFDCDRCLGEGKVERRFPVPVHIPQSVTDGTVFQVTVDDPGVLCVLLTVHIRPR